MAGRAGATRGLAAAALKHFLDHPGTYVRVEDLAYELGEVEQVQASNAVSYLIREGKLPGLKAVQKGNVWVYEPEGDDETKWALVRVTANGAQAVLEDTEGNLWIAKPAGI